MRARRAAAIVVALGLLAGCGGGGNGSPPSTDLDAETPGIVGTTLPGPGADVELPVSVTSLDGRAFRSTAVEGFELSPGKQLEVVFARSVMTATLGCATMQAPFQVRADIVSWRVEPTLTYPPVACAPVDEPKDDWLRAALAFGLKAELVGDLLTLSGDDVELTLEAVEADPVPPGLYGTTWMLETVIDDEAPSGPPSIANIPYIEFRGNGAAALSTGCNEGTASAELSIELGEMSGTIELTSVTLTDITCEGAIGDLDRLMQSLFDGESVVSLAGNLLTIGRDGTALVYRATDQ